MRTLDFFALLLVIIGGVNWGLVGLFQLDLVAALFGPGTLVSNIVYVLVGVAALYSIALFKPVLRSPITHDQKLGSSLR